MVAGEGQVGGVIGREVKENVIKSKREREETES